MLPPAPTLGVNEDEAFLTRIREDPLDDTRRLVYADLLDERNDPRGRFIRVQYQLRGTEHHRTVAAVEKERRNPYGGCCERYADRMGCDCLAQAREAEDRYGALWKEASSLYDYRWVTAPLEKVGLTVSGYQVEWPGWVGDVRASADENFPAQVAFHRGFPDKLVVPVRSFVRHADKFFSVFPLTRVVFRDAWPTDAADQSEKRAWVLVGPLTEADLLHQAADLLPQAADAGGPRRRPHTVIVPAAFAPPGVRPTGLSIVRDETYSRFDFPTVQGARDWLTANAVHYGRSKAGLAPLA